MIKKALIIALASSALTSIPLQAAEDLWSLSRDISSSSFSAGPLSKQSTPTQSVRVNEGAVQALMKSKPGESIAVPVPGGKIDATIVEVIDRPKAARSIVAKYEKDGVERSVVMSVSGKTIFADIETSDDTIQVETMKGETILRKESDLRNLPSAGVSDILLPSANPTAGKIKKFTGSNQAPSHLHMSADAPAVSAQSTLNPWELDNDGDGVVNGVEELLRTDPYDAGSVSLAPARIDILAAYNQSMVSLYGSDSAAQTRILQLNTVSNTHFANSGARITLNVVGFEPVSVVNSTAAQTVLANLRNNTGGFSNIRNRINETGADIAVYYRQYNNDGFCGVAYLGGYNSNGRMDLSTDTGRALVSADCASYVNSHEIGHNLGLMHSRVQDPNGGTFPYAVGHGIDDDFVTIMAYEETFEGQKVNLFSNENLTCRGFMGIDRPCGVSRFDDSQGADAVFTLNATGHQVAQYNSKDSDDDGLSDDEEALIGTSPTNADTDGDGMEDGWEYENDLNPLSASDANQDPDGDGLSNLQEHGYSTNPHLTDSDEDGLNDSHEINVTLTNPSQRDSDLDGMWDGWELLNGYNPLNRTDGESDTDGDGYSNREEFISGSDPRNASIYPDMNLSVRINDPLDGATFPSGTRIEFDFDFLNVQTSPVEGTLARGFLKSDHPDTIDAYANGRFLEIFELTAGSDPEENMIFSAVLPEGTHVITPVALTRRQTQVEGTPITITIGNDLDIPTIVINDAEFDENTEIYTATGYRNRNTVLSGSATDLQDGNVSSSLTWTVTDLDGDILHSLSGATVSVPVLPPGNYLIQVTARDYQGYTRRIQANLTILDQDPLPAGWSQITWGANEIESTSSFNDVLNTYTLQSVGRNISGRSDWGHFLYREVTGNFIFTARLDSLVGPNSYSTAGLMVRRNREPNSPNAFLNASTAGKYLQARSTLGGSTSRRTLQRTTEVVPAYFRLVREGTMIKGYYSETGLDDSWVYGYGYRIGLDQTALIGMAGFSRYSDLSAVSTFSNVSLVQMPNFPPVVTINGTDRLISKIPRDLTVSVVATDTEDGNIVSNVRWSLNGTQIGTGASLTIPGAMLTAGSHTLLAEVTDSVGATVSDSAEIIALYPGTTTPGWTQVNIGTETPYNANNGMVLYDGSYYVEAQGYNFTGRIDNGFFAYQAISGNFEVTMRVLSVENVNAQAAVGISVRESTNVGSKNAYLMATASYGSRFQYRNTTDGSTRVQYTDRARTVPVYMKLRRIGEYFSTQYFNDQTGSWETRATVHIPMTNSVLVGVASHSMSRDKAVNSVFTDYTVTPMGNQTPVITLTTPTPAPFTMKEWMTLRLTATANDPEYGDITPTIRWAVNSLSNVVATTGGTVDLTMANGLQRGDNTVYATVTDRDGGVSTLPISVNLYHPGASLGTYTMTNIGGGNVNNDVTLDNVSGLMTLTSQSYNATGYTDQVLFISEPVNGNFDIVTRLDSVTQANVRSAGGIMIRSSLNADSRNVYLFGTAASGTTLQARAVDGGTTSRVASNTEQATPVWLRINRVGRNFTAYTSADGTNWTLYGSTIVDMPSQVFAGRAAHSYNRSATTIATFSGFRITLNSDAAPTLTRQGNEAVRVLSWNATSLHGLAEDPEQGNISQQIVWSLDSPANIVATGSSFIPSTLQGITHGTHTVYGSITDYANNTVTLPLYVIDYVNPAEHLPAEYSLATIGERPIDMGINVAGDRWEITTGSYRATGYGDSVMFMYQSIEGDFDIAVQVESVSNTNANAAGGLMVRNSTSINSINAFVYQTNSNGVRSTYRASDGGNTTQDGSSSSTRAPSHLRMRRTGDVVTTFYATSNAPNDWIEIGNETLALNDRVYVGLAAQSGSLSSTANIVFNGVALSTALASANAIETRWGIPTTRIDNTALALSDIDHYMVYYMAHTDRVLRSIKVAGGTTQSVVIQPRVAAPHTLYIRTVDIHGLMSPASESIIVDNS